jgi:hypothetical protein
MYCRPSTPCCRIGCGIVAALLFLCGSAWGGSPYIWKAGPSNDPNWFPVSVWWQGYWRASEWGAIGVNMIVGPDAPSASDQTTLRNNHVNIIANYSASLRTVGVVKGYLQPDEPDNAQQDGNYTDPAHPVYGPCIDPNLIIKQYQTWKAADPNRPVFLGLGQGVCYNTSSPYNGRGNGSTWSQYPMYCQAADILAFDVYPYNDSGLTPYKKPKYIAIGIDRLRSWSNYQKPVWMDIETDNIGGGGRPAAYQTKAEVWIALVHGASGIQFFSQSWYPAWVSEDATFSKDPNTTDPAMVPMLTALSARIESLAPELYTTPKASLLDPNLNVNWTEKEYGGKTYLFAVALTDSNSAMPYTFHLSDLPGSLTATVLDEGRSVTLTNGVFTDDFSHLGVHLYVIPVPEPGVTALLVGGALWLLRRRQPRAAGRRRAT